MCYGKKSLELLTSSYCCSLWWKWNLFSEQIAIISLYGNQWRAEGVELEGFKPPSRNSKGPPKSCQTQPDCENCYKLLNLGRQHLKMFGKKNSKTLKLPPVRNCFTLAITNKLVVIINSLKYQKLRKFYYMKWNFLYQITAASRIPDQGATGPRSQFSVLNWNVEPPNPEQNSWERHWWQWQIGFYSWDGMFTARYGLSVTTPVDLCISNGIWHRYV